MNPNFLEFEQPIAELEAKIEELRLVGTGSEVNISEEVAKLQEKSITLTENIFSNLSSWQISQLSRHPKRPYTLDYIRRVFGEFDELHGDRAFADDPAIVGGITRLEDRPVMLIGHQKGREVKEKVRRNFGMPKPEGYRKALRLMEMAERFKMPIFTFIDTPGAFPGIDAEERGQSEAIARNLRVMSQLKVPVIATVIGEGGCASILWRSADKAPEAAEAMGLTAGRLHELGIVDEVIKEPLGGAHRDYDQAAEAVRRSLAAQLAELDTLPIPDLVQRRYERLMSYGNFTADPADE